MSDPEEETEDTSDDYQDTIQEIHEELADYNDSMSLSNDEGWFYTAGE